MAPKGAWRWSRSSRPLHRSPPHSSLGQVPRRRVRPAQHCSCRLCGGAAGPGRSSCRQCCPLHLPCRSWPLRSTSRPGLWFEGYQQSGSKISVDMLHISTLLVYKHISTLDYRIKDHGRLLNCELFAQWSTLIPLGSLINIHPICPMGSTIPLGSPIES